MNFSRNCFSSLPNSVKVEIKKNFIKIFDSEKIAYIFGKKIQLLEYKSDYGSSFRQVSEEQAKKKHLGRIRCIGTVSDEKQLLNVLLKYFSTKQQKIIKKNEQQINNSKLGWYVLVVRSGFEETILKELLSKKIDFGINEIMFSVSFSGYLFIQMEVEPSSFSGILETENVIKFLGEKKEYIEGRKVSLPKQITYKEALKLKEVKDENLNIDTKEVQFKIGDFVVVKQGDLTDVQGKIVDIKKRFVRIKPEMFTNKVVKVRLQDIGYI